MCKAMRVSEKRRDKQASCRQSEKRTWGEELDEDIFTSRFHVEIIGCQGKHLCLGGTKDESK